MKILFENAYIRPIVSIILIDWSCRESFHILRYLNNQTVPRDNYEIIWIEFYSKRSSEIDKMLKESEISHKPPIIDKWITMDISDHIYFHKHLMYNVGIIFSKGNIISICDSDVICKPTFVENIIKTFENNSNIVLHIDEVRNINVKFYPFNYPSIEDIIGHGCINWKNDRTIGLLDRNDFLHSRNYGACMCALYQDIINIGGADEHLDYLGLMNGPYEMTFRLVNAGKTEVWHNREFIYHAWHPWQPEKNINLLLGPNDGLGMSKTALDIRKTKRIMPIVENPVINMIRTRQDIRMINSDLLSYISGNDNIKDNIKKWAVDDVAKNIVIEGYRNILKRDPDPDGLREYIEHIKNGMSITRFHEILITSDEYIQNHLI